MKVLNKVIVVTGGGRGMGRGLVLNLLGKGAMVAAVDINEASLQETAKLAGNKAGALSVFVTDITNRSAMEGLSEKVFGECGHVYGIINNAGIIQPFIKVNDLGYEAIERVMNINFY